MKRSEVGRISANYRVGSEIHPEKWYRNNAIKI